ncbi:MAG: DEAD/DEAH box helicase [Candidatus Saccharimonas sp.]
MPPALPSQSIEVSDFLGMDLGDKSLPAYNHKREIIDTIDNNRIVLLTGPTGSGKTTQLAQYALEAGYDRVIYLLPRRINVDNNTEFIREQLGEQIGQERAHKVVGMAHSEHSDISDESIVQIMTAGTFSRMARDMGERWAGKRVMIVADETHENGLPTEFASAQAVRLVEQHDAWRMVFASATPDEGAMASYEAVNGGEVPTVTIEGRPHDLEFIEEPELDIVEAYHKHSVGVQKSMMFVDGKVAIKETINALRRSMADEEVRRTKFFKLHSKISSRAQEAIFHMELEPGERAIIVSTSAGQSGITIPGLGLVLSSGLTKSPELDGESAPGLPLRRCTRGEIVQQGGRAGRDIDGGKCVLARPRNFASRRNLDNELYQFMPLASLEPDMPPEIYHSNIARNVLAAAVMGEDFTEFNNYLKHSVSQRTIHEAYDVLDHLGAIDDDNKATDLGHLMDMFPLRPELGRAAAEIVHSHKLQIQVFVLAIAAAVEAGGLADFDNGHSGWREHLRDSTDDDFIAQLDLMRMSRQFFYGYTVNEDALASRGLDFKNTYQAHRQLDKMCRSIGLDMRDVDFDAEPTPDEEDEVRSIFLAGMPDLLYEKTATVHRKGVYKNVLGFESAVPREISQRSLLAVGQAAVKLVAGYPRWYTNAYGERHDIIDFGFATSATQVRQVLGAVATPHLHSEVRGGRLIKSGVLNLGTLSLGQVNSFEARSGNDEERKLLVGEIMYSDMPAIRVLRSLGVSDEAISLKCFELSGNASSVRELDSRLWGYVASMQQPR